MRMNWRKMVKGLTLSRGYSRWWDSDKRIKTSWMSPVKYKRTTWRLEIKTTSSQTMTYNSRTSAPHKLPTPALKQQLPTLSSPNFSRLYNLATKTTTIGSTSIQMAAMTSWTFMIMRLSKHPYLRMNHQWSTVGNRLLRGSHVQLTKD